MQRFLITNTKKKMSNEQEISTGHIFGPLKNRVGIVRFANHFLEDPKEDVMLATFSNFFPWSIGNDHSAGIYGFDVMFGYSMHFREICVSEGEDIPEYIIRLKRVDGVVLFDKMVEKTK